MTRANTTRRAVAKSARKAIPLIRWYTVPLYTTAGWIFFPGGGVLPYDRPGVVFDLAGEPAACAWMSYCTHMEDGAGQPALIRLSEDAGGIPTAAHPRLVKNTDLRSRDRLGLTRLR